MPKVPPFEPARPTLTLKMLNDLRQQAQRLKMTGIEREITNLLLFEGYDLRWAMYTGTNFASAMGGLIERGTVVVKHALHSLEERGWIDRGVNGDGQTYVELTTKFIAACRLAWQRYLVRRTVGAVRWQKCNGDGAVADLLHQRALGRGRGSYKDRLKSVADAYIDGVERRQNSGWVSHPGRVGKKPSQGGNPTLRLIAGERKSGA